MPVLSNRAGKFLNAAQDLQVGAAGIREEQHHQTDFGEMEEYLWAASGLKNPLQGGKHQHARDCEHNGRGDNRLFQSPRQRD